MQRWIIAGFASGLLLLLWTVLAFTTISGPARWFCVSCALAGAAATFLLFLWYIAQGNLPPMLATGGTVVLAVILPLFCILLGNSLAGKQEEDRAQQAATQPGPQAPVSVTPPQTGEAVRAGEILSMQAQDFDESIRWAAQQGPRTGPTVQTVSLKPGPPFTKEDDGEGGGTISFRVPGAPRIIRTGWQAKHKEVFYISTPQGSIRNLQVGRRDVRNDETPWMTIRPGHTSPAKPLCWRNATAPEAELCFSTVAVPPGEYTIRAQKGVQPVEWGEYLPGVRAGPVY